MFLAFGFGHFHSYYLADYLKTAEASFWIRISLMILSLTLTLVAGAAFIFVYMYPLGPVVLTGLLVLIGAIGIVTLKYRDFPDKFDSFLEKLERILTRGMSLLFAAYMVVIMLTGIIMLLGASFYPPLPANLDDTLRHSLALAGLKILALVMILLSLVGGKDFWVRVIGWIVDKIPGNKS